eukprot:12451304-Ditylum_brightwellii.AAC.1
MVELAKSKQSIGNKTDDDLLTIDAMKDKDKIHAMRLMYNLAVSSFMCDQGMYCVLALRMLQMSLCYGLCDASAFAFASYGCLLSGIDDFHGAYRFGKLSLRLLGASESKKDEVSCKPQAT